MRASIRVVPLSWMVRALIAVLKLSYSTLPASGSERLRSTTGSSRFTGGAANRHSRMKDFTFP